MVTLVKALRDHTFTGDDNKEVKGKYIYLQVVRDDGSQVNKRYFIPEDRLLDFAHIPSAGDRVLVYTSNDKIVDMLKDESKK